VDVGGCDGVEAVLEALRGFTGEGRGPGGEWIVGHGFDESTWSSPRLPTRAEIDAVQARRPVLLQRVCGHVGVANSAALRAVAPGPHTDLDSGRLAEDDLYAVNDRLRPRAAALAAVWPRVAATLQAHGITAVHDVTSPEMWQALVDRRREPGDLGVRVSASMPARYLESGAEAAALRARRAEAAALPGDAAQLRLLGIKIFADGSLGARTAFLRQPYADAPATRGVALYTPTELAGLARRVHEAGFQLMVHAIGDAALDLALAALEPVLAGGNGPAHRLEHAEVTPPDVVRRLAASGARVCVQPNFAGRWSQPGGMNEQRLGPQRLRHCNVYRTLLEAGVQLAFGSDTMPLGPAFGLRSAIQHPIETERLAPDTALGLYTAAGAALVGDAGGGRLVPGGRADVVILHDDPQGGWVVETTLVGGRPVHPAAAAAGPA
jgi:predicted amidohydrolase YtcJ